jgi:hypothetical protein
LEELQHLLKDNGIDSIKAAMRSKDLAKLGDPLTNLLHSLAQSLTTNRFSGKKVSGKTLATALRLADLRQLAPPRLDAHGLGDCVEAVIAYAWICGTLNIAEASKLLAQEFQLAISKTEKTRQSKSKAEATAFAALLRNIWEKEQKGK